MALTLTTVDSIHTLPEVHHSYYSIEVVIFVDSFHTYSTAMFPFKI